MYIFLLQVSYHSVMANCYEVSDIEEKICLESPVFPLKQVKKVDEQLTIEFTDIKQEPSFHFDHKQNVLQSRIEIKSKCISCDTSSFASSAPAPPGTADTCPGRSKR